MALHTRLTTIRNFANALRIATQPGSPTVPERASAVPRMVRAALSGQYTGISKLRIGALAGAVAYIVSPIDLLPEGLFAVVGLADDAVVLSWLAANLVMETEAFLEWERGGMPVAASASAGAGPASASAGSASFGAGSGDPGSRNALG